MTNILSMFPNYPTQEEIMNSPVKHKKETLKAVKGWRQLVWKEVKNGNPREKFDGLARLINIISMVYNKPCIVIFEPDGQIGCRYNPVTKTIVIDRSLSIVSTLHELAHHLFGENEKIACRWSIWLFKKVWPKAFAKLRWEGHLLKRQ